MLLTRSSLPFTRLAHLSATVALLAVVGCKKDKVDPQPPITTHNFHLELEHLGANGRPLKLDTVYTNAAGNRYVVNVLKYFVSNVQFTRQDGTIWSEPASYHLVTVPGAPADNPEIEVKDLPLGTYTSVSFAIGVDSVANSRTDHVGDLNPTSDMVWDWNTGYIFFKLLGRHVVGPTPNPASDPALDLQIGTATTYRRVTLPLPQAATVTATISPEAHLAVAVNKLFGGPNVISFGPSDYHVSGGAAPGPQLADNYATMFVVSHVHNEPDPQ